MNARETLIGLFSRVPVHMYPYLHVHARNARDFFADRAQFRKWDPENSFAESKGRFSI